MVAISKVSWHYRLCRYVYGPNFGTRYTDDYSKRVEYAPSVFVYGLGVLGALLLTPFVAGITRQTGKSESGLGRSLGVIAGFYTYINVPVFTVLNWPDLTFTAAMIVILTLLITVGKEMGRAAWISGVKIHQGFGYPGRWFHSAGVKLHKKIPKVEFKET